jgi:hypothetical protein
MSDGGDRKLAIGVNEREIVERRGVLAVSVAEEFERLSRSVRGVMSFMCKHAEAAQNCLQPYAMKTVSSGIDNLPTAINSGYLLGTGKGTDPWGNPVGELLASTFSAVIGFGLLG